ncbi:ubiquitin-conjugating enzyme E2 J2-like [Episyrphus balteatus]|uniref:ubiquitin-conjugating enzyme E2 J2-like n=1 Tax=Episyrphus balteatus TaxID=286459 RepID=UPI002485A033|nr:ubiquitin-conjugating enzyme E2 J2-like [Episyrphus balteatus]
MTNHNPTAISRMKKDYLRLQKDPIPYITAEPLPTNLLEWHYVVKGPENSPYQGGYYHGTILFPNEFPFKPPSIYILTPNGRFKTKKPLCLNITDYHPITWNPTWSVDTILTGLLSFMLEEIPTMGSMESSLYEKQQFAKKSLEFNLKNSQFCELFPQLCDEIKVQLEADKKCNNNEFVGRPEEDSTGDDFDLSENNKNSNLDSSSYCKWHSIYSYLTEILIYAIFALIVNYVIKNLD